MVNVDSAAELKTKIEGFKSRFERLRQEQARLEERVSSSSETCSKIEKEFTELTGTSSVEEGEAKCEAIFVELQSSIQDLEGRLQKAGF
jgi:predicted nuclease with TOPRIM domain